jgi:hypothetical protein
LEGAPNGGAGTGDRHRPLPHLGRVAISRGGKASTAAAALEQALLTRFGTLGRVATPFLLRSDNGLVFTSRIYTRLVRSYGLKQEFITPQCPRQNGMVERAIRTWKEQCAHRHRFETQQHAMRVIGDWIGFCNHRRPHQAPSIEYTRSSVCFGGLTCAGTVGSLHAYQASTVRRAR